MTSVTLKPEEQSSKALVVIRIAPPIDIFVRAWLLEKKDNEADSQIFELYYHMAHTA